MDSARLTRKTPSDPHHWKRRGSGGSQVGNHREIQVHTLPRLLPGISRDLACNRHAWQERPSAWPNRTLQGMGPSPECRFGNRRPNLSLWRRTVAASCSRPTAATMRKHQQGMTRFLFAVLDTERTVPVQEFHE